MKKLLRIKRKGVYYVKIPLLAFLMLMGVITEAQVSSFSPINQLGSPSDFLGWEPSVNSDVNIRHLTPGEPILFGTNGVERMRISPNVNRSVLINTNTANNAKSSIRKILSNPLY